jgi:hypothetical protein
VRNGRDVSLVNELKSMLFGFWGSSAENSQIIVGTDNDLSILMDVAGPLEEPRTVIGLPLRDYFENHRNYHFKWEIVNVIAQIL